MIVYVNGLETNAAKWRPCQHWRNQMNSCTHQGKKSYVNFMDLRMKLFQCVSSLTNMITWWYQINISFGGKCQVPALQSHCCILKTCTFEERRVPVMKLISSANCTNNLPHQGTHKPLHEHSQLSQVAFVKTHAFKSLLQALRFKHHKTSSCSCKKGVLVA